VITEFPAVASTGPLDTALRAITNGPDGKLWFTTGDHGQVGTISVAGEVTLYPLPLANSGPEDITQGPDGNLWFTEYYASKLGRITPTGAITEFACQRTRPRRPASSPVQTGRSGSPRPRPIVSFGTALRQGRAWTTEAATVSRVEGVGGRDDHGRRRGVPQPPAALPSKRSRAPWMVGRWRSAQRARASTGSSSVRPSLVSS